MKKIFLMIVILLLVPATIFAANQKHEDRYLLLHSDKLVTVYLDTSTIKIEPNKITVWFKHVLTDEGVKSKMHNAHGLPNLSYKFTREALKIDTREEALLEMIYYDSNGSVLRSAYASYPVYNSIVPDSKGESIWNSVSGYILKNGLLD